MFLWLFSEIYYAFRLRSIGSDTQGKDKLSFWILWIVIPFSIFFSITFSQVGAPPILNYDWFSYLGLLFIGVGIVTRYFIIQNLGKFFTVDVTIRKGHQLKQDGFYKIIRHPSYAFSMLTFLGLGMFLNNWLSLAVACVPPFLAFSYRILIEEKALLEQFGTEYEQYRTRTKKIIPFIY